MGFKCLGELGAEFSRAKYSSVIFNIAIQATLIPNNIPDVLLINLEEHGLFISRFNSFNTWINLSSSWYLQTAPSHIDHLQNQDANQTHHTLIAFSSTSHCTIKYLAIGRSTSTFFVYSVLFLSTLYTDLFLST